MKYFYTGTEKSNLAKTDGINWWITDETGAWIPMTAAMFSYIQDGNPITVADPVFAHQSFAEWFPDAKWVD